MDTVDIYTVCVTGGSNIEFDCNVNEITIANDKWAAVNISVTIDFASDGEPVRYNPFV